MEIGRGINRDDLLRTLSEYGYAREDLIASPGEYAWRGGIVDVFSPWEANPFRIELGGAEVVFAPGVRHLQPTVAPETRAGA